MAMAGTTVETMETAVKTRAGKYLTFKLAGEEYGLEILRVTTIIGLLEITAVPDIPAFVRGVINLRGKVIPVVDLRKKFGLESISDTNETCIIVAEVNRGDAAVSMGVLVDSVSEVLDIPEEAIEDTPFFGDNEDRQGLLGLAKVNNDVKILLDIDKVLHFQTLALN